MEEIKKHDWKDVIAWQLQRDNQSEGKKEKTDHDLIAYGVSRDGTTLEECESGIRKKTGKKK